MTARVGANGFDRIDRNYLRVLVAPDADLEVAVVNDLTDNKTLAYFPRYDSILRCFPGEVSYDNDAIKVGGKEIEAFAKQDPANLLWGESGADITTESTGFFTDATKAKTHLGTGAKKAPVSTSAKNEDAAIVTDVNDGKYDPAAHDIISNVSCTTNRLTPMTKALNSGLSIVKSLVTTIHAYTQDQNLQDDPHKDLYRVRAAVPNTVPTTTGAAKAVALVLLKLKDKFDGYAPHVPIPTDPAIGLISEAPRETNVEEISEIVEKAVDGRALVYIDESLASRDIRTDSASYTFDFQLAEATGNQVRVVDWCDNEWGYSNRLVDLMALVSSKF